MASNENSPAFILEAVIPLLTVKSQSTASQRHPTPASTPPINHIGPPPDHSIAAPTSLLPTNNHTNEDSTNGNVANGNVANGNVTNGNVTNGKLPSDQRGSWLFRLPAEMRLMIWRELLVTRKVYISFTNCRLLMAQRGAKRKQRATWEVSEFDDQQVEYYGVLGDDTTGEEAHVGTYFSPRRCHDDWFMYAKRCMSQKLPTKFRDSYHPRPDLNIFLACRLAREEAEPVFYSENCFTFCTCNQRHDYNAARDISAAHAAHCFFQDRSPGALRQIKHIELHAMH